MYPLPYLESHFPSTTVGFHAEVLALLHHWHSHYLEMDCPDAQLRGETRFNVGNHPQLICYLFQDVVSFNVKAIPENRILALSCGKAEADEVISDIREVLRAICTSEVVFTTSAVPRPATKTAKVRGR